MKKIIIASATLAIASALLLKLPLSYQLLLFLAILTLPPAAFFFYHEFLEGKKTSQLEEAIPHAAMQIASFPSRSSNELVAKTISQGGYGELSSEFTEIEKRMQAGASFPNALQASAKKRNSRLFRQFTVILTLSHHSGGDVSNALKAFADDAFCVKNLKNEMQASLAMQKYTILASGCLLVPAILGVLLKVVSTLNLDSSTIGLPLATKNALLEAVTLGNYLYLFTFSLISSAFLGVIDSSSKKAILYFILLFPLALAVFTLTRG